MKKDRLKDDSQTIHRLDDLIDARSEGTSHIAEDRDSLECDLEFAEDTDVDEALTFPHPRRKTQADIELMDTPHEEDMDDDWDNRDLLPTDYAHGYNEATTADVRDELDERAEDEVHKIDHLSLSQMEGEPPIETMPNTFSPEDD